ncbi:hypothetical protein BsIDN1_46120 [Bacillus safensis]|uniref:Uncharacterized protein n=1 Tax=Bacillus safensis TaxID=561879 RepID=A0A5S9MFS7_BACIA|nr:hypothetical protein BsIDN1_46120 [Bacillus safensis]
MAYAWDLETNTRQTKIFTVKHERKAKGAITKLNDPRDIYELVAKTKVHVEFVPAFLE